MLKILGTYVLIVMVVPAVLLPVLALALTIFLVVRLYLTCATTLQSLEGQKRAPIFSQALN